MNIPSTWANENPCVPIYSKEEEEKQYMQYMDSRLYTFFLISHY